MPLQHAYCSMETVAIGDYRVQQHTLSKHTGWRPRSCSRRAESCSVAPVTAASSVAAPQLAEILRIGIQACAVPLSHERFLQPARWFGIEDIVNSYFHNSKSSPLAS